MASALSSTAEIRSLARRSSWTRSRAPSWRDDYRGDPLELADELRRAAVAIRSLHVDAVDARLLNEVLKPESYAELFDHPAAIIEAADQA